MDAAHTAQRRGTFFGGVGRLATGGREMSTDEGLLRKAALRRRLTAQRKALHPDQVDARGLKVQSRFLATPDYQRARTVALYAPFGGEVPTRDILTAAVADGKVVCYPLSHVRGRVLSFRAVRSEAELEPGRLGVREPTDAGDLVPVEQIDLFVVPGLGFTREGKRLGRGGGYYDATLRAGRPGSRRVGLAFAEQLVEDLPTDEHDMDLHLVVTENEAFRGELDET